jgi:hypothetical protein
LPSIADRVVLNRRRASPAERLTRSHEGSLRRTECPSPMSTGSGASAGEPMIGNSEWVTSWRLTIPPRALSKLERFLDERGQGDQRKPGN